MKVVYGILEIVFRFYFSLFLVLFVFYSLSVAQKSTSSAVAL